MKKLLLSVTACLAVGLTSLGQTSLFSDNFESGPSQWTLNGGTGDNAWAVNNAYLGWTGFINDTPNQPGGIFGSPQSNYLHIVNGLVCSSLSVCNANYDTGATSNQSAEITTAINASTYTNITVSFWYLCTGQTGTAYGTMEYSLDGGSTWTGTGTNYVNVGVWTQESVSLPAWDNAASFKIRFTWQNAGGSGSDPAFSIDDFDISGTPGGGGSNAITTGTSIVPTEWCEGNLTTLQVDFTSTGTFNPGNIYTAELSDATGSFAAPLSIGTLASTANSGMITAMVPGSVPAGTGYRIRVVSDNPATVGSDNGADLTIHPLPTVTQAPFTDACEQGGVVNLVGASPAGGTYSGTGVSGVQFNPATAGVGSTNITYTYTDGNGCTNQVTEPITVLASPSVTQSTFANVCDDDPMFTLTGGSPAGGTYTGPGVTAGVFNPATAGAGTHTLTYTYTDGNGCSGTANETITVEVCGSVFENGSIKYELYPNPANESFSIKTEAQVDEVSLLDMSGRVVKTYNSNFAEMQINEIPSGVYLINVEIEGEVYTTRLVKK
jgi:hypothetical protein